VMGKEDVAHRTGADLLQDLIVTDRRADLNHAWSISPFFEVDRHARREELHISEEDDGADARLVLEDVEGVLGPLFHDVQVARMDLDAAMLAEATVEDEHIFRQFARCSFLKIVFVKHLGIRY